MTGSLGRPLTDGTGSKKEKRRRRTYTYDEINNATLIHFDNGKGPVVLRQWQVLPSSDGENNTQRRRYQSLKRHMHVWDCFCGSRKPLNSKSQMADHVRSCRRIPPLSTLPLAPPDDTLLSSIAALACTPATPSETDESPRGSLSGPSSHCSSGLASPQLNSPAHAHGPSSQSMMNHSQPMMNHTQQMLAAHSHSHSQSMMAHSQPMMAHTQSMMNHSQSMMNHNHSQPMINVMNGHHHAMLSSQNMMNSQSIMNSHNAQPMLSSQNMNILGTLNSQSMMNGQLSMKPTSPMPLRPVGTPCNSNLQNGGLPLNSPYGQFIFSRKHTKSAFVRLKPRFSSLEGAEESNHEMEFKNPQSEDDESLSPTNFSCSSTSTASSPVRRPVVLCQPLSQGIPVLASPSPCVPWPPTHTHFTFQRKALGFC